MCFAVVVFCCCLVVVVVFFGGGGEGGGVPINSFQKSLSGSDFHHTIVSNSLGIDQTRRFVILALF